MCPFSLRWAFPPCLFLLLQILTIVLARKDNFMLNLSERYSPRGSGQTKKKKTVCLMSFWLCLKAYSQLSGLLSTVPWTNNLQKKPLTSLRRATPNGRQDLKEEGRGWEEEGIGSEVGYGFGGWGLHNKIWKVKRVMSEGRQTDGQIFDHLFKF